MAASAHVKLYVGEHLESQAKHTNRLKLALGTPGLGHFFLHNRILASFFCFFSKMNKIVENKLLTLGSGISIHFIHFSELNINKYCAHTYLHVYIYANINFSHTHIWLTCFLDSPLYVFT